MSKTTDESYVRRALAAYYRSGGTGQPSASDVFAVDGRRYVELMTSDRRNLATYRIDTVGRLKRLKRWPKRPTIIAQAAA
jgi:hypothetical protein